MTTFHTPLNGVSTTVTAARAVGVGTIAVADGAAFGASFPLIATAVRAATVLCIFEVTGCAGNVLSVSGPIEGTSDAALLVGDTIEMRPTALAITEIQRAVLALEETTVSTTSSYADPSWLTAIAASKVAGDIAGNASGITGEIAESQVTGLTADLAARAIDATVVHLGGTETITGSKTFASGMTSGGVITAYGQVIVGQTIIATGAAGVFLVSRRDNGDSGWGFFSQNGEFSFFNYNTSSVGLTVGADNSVTFVGGLRPPILADASAPAGSIYLSSGNLDANGDPRLCRKGPSGNVTVIG
jgi:hypothetical protein